MGSQSKKSKGLGRGLDAFFGGELADDVLNEDNALGNLRKIEISALREGRYQPRTQMDDEQLSQLAESIRQEGILSPILVRPIGGGQYEIVAGERRYRAAIMAGLDRVPVIVKEVDDKHALAMALIENIQRENLNPLEEAAGIERLISEFGFTHKEAAEAIGRSRSAASNLLRLLDLTEIVKEMLSSRQLEMGHARALLGLQGATQILAAKTVVERGFSVRQTEDYVKRLLDQDGRKQKKVVIKTKDDERLEESLAETLGAVVKLRASPKGRGKIVIEFSSLEQLQGIVDKIQR